MRSHNYLKLNEILACKILSNLRYSKVVSKFCNNKKNRRIIRIANLLLCGEDAVDFIARVAKINDKEMQLTGLHNLREE